MIAAWPPRTVPHPPGTGRPPRWSGPSESRSGSGGPRSGWPATATTPRIGDPAAYEVPCHGPTTDMWRPVRPTDGDWAAGDRLGPAVGWRTGIDGVPCSVRGQSGVGGDTAP